MYLKLVASSAVLALAVASLAFPLVGTSGTAKAGPTETPNGLCGAKNMVNDAAKPHMIEAMTYHTADQGDTGMFTAVGATAC